MTWSQVIDIVVRRYRLFDWLTCVALFLMGGGIVLWAKPYCRVFSLSDATIGFPHHKDTFPNWSLAPIAVLPCVAYILFGIFGTPRYRSDLHRSVEISRYLLLQAMSVTLNELVTEGVKYSAGRLRPDFLSRLAASGCNATLVAKATDCCFSNTEMVEGRLSFPSGHTSWAFAALVPFSLFLAWRFRVAHTGQFLPTIVSLLPMLLALVVFVSRTIDFRHNFSDVLAGAVIGSSSAMVAWLLFLGQMRDPAFAAPMESEGDDAEAETPIKSASPTSATVIAMGTYN
jgi:diacylglycerol diphosphate phosphatase/phosphatidate phosphatase